MAGVVVYGARATDQPVDVADTEPGIRERRLRRFHVEFPGGAAGIPADPGLPDPDDGDVRLWCQGENLLSKSKPAGRYTSRRATGMTRNRGPAGDRDQILNAMAAYVHAVDDRDLDLLGTVFTDDTVWVRDTGPVEGLEAIRANLRSTAGNRPRLRHIVANQRIAVEGDTATAVSDFYLVRPGEAWSIVGAGRYHDLLERRGGDWVFRRREIVHLALDREEGA